jgi:signal peptidase I
MDQFKEVNPSASKESAEAKKPKAPLIQTVFDTLEIFCLAVVMVILIFTFVGRMATVVGDSMYPTLYNKDRVVVSSFLYTPECGDIVVVQKESGHYDDQLLIKRVIAKGGQTITFDFASWTVSVDGEIIDEPYINRVAESMRKGDMTSDTVTVPEGCYFVLGDNRNGSSDSRYNTVGFVKETEIVGKAVYRVSPVFSKLEHASGS